MHDGTVGTLAEVIDFYDSGGRANPLLDADIRPLGLTQAEKGQLAAFLRALSGELQSGVHGPRGAANTRTAICGLGLLRPRGCLRLSSRVAARPSHFGGEERQRQECEEEGAGAGFSQSSGIRLPPP